MVSGFVAFCKKICSHMCCSSYMSSTYFSDCSKFLIIIVLCLGFGFAIFEMRSHKSCLGKWWAFCWDLWDVTWMTQMLPSLTPAMLFRHLRCYLDFSCFGVVTYLSQPCFLIPSHPPHDDKTSSKLTLRFSSSFVLSSYHQAQVRQNPTFKVIIDKCLTIR